MIPTERMAADRPGQADRPRLARRERWRAALMLLALLMVTQYDVIFLGRSLIATNYSNPLDWRATPQNYGPDFVPHETWTSRNLWPYANIRDAGATWWQWEPSTQFLKQAIHDREWPFWDPYLATGGAPAMANLIPAFFFPPYLVVVLLGASVPLLNAYFLFLIWAPAFFTFLFMQRHEVGFLPALTAAAAVMLGGSVHQHAGTFIGQTAACLPFVMYMTRRFFDAPTGARAAGLALAYAAAALASFPPLLLAIFGIAALYGVIALGGESSATRRRTAALWVAALAIAVGLVGFYYVPAITARAATTQMELYRDSGLETMPVRNLFQLVSATLMGGILTYLDTPIRPEGANAYIPYAGVVAVALALLAYASGSARRWTLFLTSLLATATIVLKLTGSPLVQWIGALPALNQIHMAQYFGIPLGFLIACLAGLGLHALLEGGVGTLRALTTAVAVVAVPEALWNAAGGRKVFASPAFEYWMRDWWILAGVSLAAAAAIAIGALERGRPRVRLLTAGVAAAVLVGDLVYMGWYPNPAAWSIFDHPIPYVRALQESVPDDRVFAVDAPHPNLTSGFRISAMESMMAFNPPRSHQLYVRYTKRPISVFMHAPAALPPEPVLDRANVAAISLARAYVDVLRDAEARGYRSVFDDGFFTVLRRNTLPRFFFSSAYRVASPEAALEDIARSPATEIVLEHDPGVPSAPNAPGDPAVVVESSRRNSAMVSVDAPRPGLLYASDAFFDGWTAYVNGRPAPILPANFAFRAVAIPAGRVRVEFRYWPPGLSAGLAVSGVSVLAVCVLAFAPLFRRATRQASAPRTTSAGP